MRDRELYARILGLPEPWVVADVDLDPAARSVLVKLGLRDGATLACPECGQTCPVYDTQPRRWRHLDTCQFQTILEADVPRASCPEHGVRQIRVPFAGPGSHFTALFERLAIDWMTEAGRSATARQLDLSWAAPTMPTASCNGRWIAVWLVGRPRRCSRSASMKSRFRGVSS